MKGFIITAAMLLGTSAHAVARPITTHELYLEQRVCETVPERQSGYIRAAGQTIHLTTPEHQECSYVPTHRLRSTTHYHR